MGIDTDQEMVQIMGIEPEAVDGAAPPLHECAQEGIRTSTRTLLFIDNKAKLIHIAGGSGGAARSARRTPPLLQKGKIPGKHPNNLLWKLVLTP